MSSQREPSDVQIESFWDWFLQQSDVLARMLESDKTDELYSLMNERIRNLHSGLRWEAGPGRRKPYSLTITFGGDPELRTLARTIIDAAPQCDKWEFFSAKQSRKPPSEILFGSPAKKFYPGGWRFSVARKKRFDLTIFDDVLATIDENTALGVVFIYLDALLGEDVVEREIGDIRFEPLSESAETLPMSDLSRLIQG
jgi:hypothetical protein